MNFYKKEIADIFKELDTSETGLSSSQIENRKDKYGQNVFEKHKKASFFKKFILQFTNIMIIILIISAIISCVMAITNRDLQNLFEGILIFVIVIINAIVGVIQEQKAENALSALEQKTTKFSKIYRDKQLQKININDVVVGDIISLSAGDYVPADIRLIETNKLKCDESSLTGESHEIAKHSKTIKANHITISAQSNMCFSGTNIISGSGTGVVVSVGKNTELGKIAKMLKTSKKEKTPLEKNIDKIGKTLTIGILAIVAVVFIVQVLFNKNITIMQALLTSVALAVAAIPESLPAVITIIMALGVQKLAKKNAIVKKLSAVETLGCCNIICTDKTGTLTENKMSVEHIFTKGTITKANEFNLNQNAILWNLLLNCNSRDSVTKNATENAISCFLDQKNIDFSENQKKNEILNINEFSSTKKIMSVVIEQNGQKILMVKGAIDYILPKCTQVLTEENVSKNLTEGALKYIIDANENICLNGERVIAFAYKNADNNMEENDLIFVGFVGIIDPPKKDVFEAIKQNKKAGIKTIMITGDHPTTALAIAKTLGIASDKKEVLTGIDLDHIDKKQLPEVIQNYSVFARVTPEHKLVIVNALKKNNNVVAMTGDGVNDAPSIKSANIGVCMGITGTDVTKEVADIILTDDNCTSITQAVKQGRTIYNNITKTILFLLSTNVVEVLGIFITSLVMHDYVFLLPSQILFINLITDSLPAFALGIEPPEKDIMSKPPRNSNSSLLSGTVGSSIIYQGFIQTLVVLVMFVIANNKFGNQVASTMSFLTICFMQVIHSINCKSEKSIFKINIFKNKVFNFSFVLLIALILAVYFCPPIAWIFSVTPLTLTQWLYIVITSIMIIPAVELGKIFIK